MKLSKRERILIGIAILVIIGVGVDSLMRQPTVASLFRGDLKARLIQQEAKGRQMATEAEVLRKDIRRLQEKMKSLAVRKPPQKLVPATMKALQKTAKTARVVLTEIRPLRQEEESGWIRIPIELRLQESFPRVVEFLYQLESPDRKMIIRKVRLASSDSESDRVDAQVQIEIFAALEGGNQVEKPPAGRSDSTHPADTDHRGRPEETDLNLTRGAL